MRNDPAMTPGKDSPPALEVGPATRVLQIIIGALLTGSFCLFLVATLMPVNAPAGRPPQGPMRIAGLPMLTTLAFAFAAVLAVLSGAVPALVVKTARKKRLPLKPEDDRGAMIATFTTQLIIGVALLEAAAQFAGISYLIEHQDYAIHLMMALMAGIAYRFPTLAYAERWVDDQCERVAEERMMSA